ncbi:MAG: hypothetical protein HYS04_20775 [Acidobacteria bacterium]|nr:hypothetical protein [Acidobacteriota bacterium]
MKTLPQSIIRWPLIVVAAIGIVLVGLVVYAGRGRVKSGRIKSGRIVLPQTWRFDLDSGELATGSADDLWFEVSESGERFLTPVNGALMKAAGIGQHVSLTPRLCDPDDLITDKVSEKVLHAGSRILVLTNSAGCVDLRITAGPGPGPGFATLVAVYEIRQ